MRQSVFGICVFLAAAGTGCSAAKDGAKQEPPQPSAATITASASAPPPATSNPPCVVSADCPAGEHCDLEACVQDCNAVDPCTGDLTCSPRARCLAAGAADVDPQPSGQSAGALSVSPATVQLTDEDTSFPLTLTSSGTDAVRYRVVVSGPYLSVAQPSGTFTGSTTLPVQVNSSGVKGSNVSGTVSIISTLGDAVVNAPIHAGVTGSYKGELHYDGGPIDLGTAAVTLDVLESAGAVQMRVNAEDSMLFPAIGGAAATGQGLYAVSTGIDATVAQVVDPSFGGARNPFNRPIGRQVRFQVMPDSLGNLAGTFQETIVGLFAEPITTSGHVTLQYVPESSDPSFSLATPPAMPASPPKNEAWDIGQVLGYSETSTCAGLDLAAVDASDATPSLARFAGQTSSSVNGPTYDDVATVCGQALSEPSLAAMQADPSAQGCGAPQEIAFALSCGATSVSPSDVPNAIVVGELTQDTLAAPLLVAKNDVVDALLQSFTSGPSSESTYDDNAMAALEPYAAWVLQPAVLEFLRSLVPEAAAGNPPATGDVETQSQPYPAARALADLLSTSSTIDAERTRIVAQSGAPSATDVATAQERALLAYLEMAALSEILNEWQTAPASIASTFIGALTPLDQSFTALLAGTNVFGIPDGFVPFVYRPAQASAYPTNFEQALAMAKQSVAAEATDEANFLTDARTFDAEVQQLQTELVNVKSQYDTQIKADCGTDFDPDAVTSTSDPGWSACGANNEGAVGLALLTVDSANAQLTTAQSAIQGQGQKIQIDVSALAQTEDVEAQTIAFTAQNGDAIAADDFETGLLSAATEAIGVAANAQVWNDGAPLAEAALDLILGAEKASLASNRDELQTAETMQVQMEQEQTGAIQAMANIQKEEIDLAQAVTSITQQEIAVVSADAQVSQQVAAAQQLWLTRQAQLEVIGEDPTKDPSYRLLRDSTALRVLADRAAAQQALYMATSALEYEVDMSISNVEGAVMNANDNANMQSLENCLQGIFNQSIVAYGSPQDYVTTVSIAQMLGITGSRTDPVTGQTLSAGDQFRQILLQNSNLDGRGGVGITFSTDLQAGNGLWSDDVCEDRIASIQAELVGDFLGDYEAQVNLTLGGGGVLRPCGSDTLVTWSFGAGANDDPTAFAVVQAGVNTFGDDSTVNTALFDQPVARANWTLTVPGAMDAPANADVDVTQIDDVVLKIDHQAIAQHTSPISLDLSCLSNVGN